MGVGAARDRGSVTAELAVALPAVVLVLGACVWGVQLAAAQVRLEDAAGLAARAAARGDAVEDALRAAPPGAAVATWPEGDLACARVAVAAAAPLGLPPVPLAAESCALREAP